MTSQAHDAAARPDPSDDAELMRRALALAERGRGQVSPNPLVGALVVSPDGVIVGRGYHARAGTPHAEIHALRDAGDRARGATLYCTLEPCCHTGRTGPCTVAIEQAGIARVVAAIDDPNPLVAGGGFAYLRDRGIDVTSDVLRPQAAAQNAVFRTNIRRQRPFVTLKIAMSLDGRIAAAPGVRTALTAAEANRDVQRLRAEVDAMAIGSGTLLTDDPLLTARDVYRARPLTRVVFDGRLRTPPTARLFGTLDAGPIVIVTEPAAIAAHPARAEALTRAGATLLPVSPRDLPAAMAELWKLQIASVLLEGGAALHAAAWQAGIVDHVRMYITPDALASASSDGARASEINAGTGASASTGTGTGVDVGADPEAEAATDVSTGSGTDGGDTAVAAIAADGADGAAPAPAGVLWEMPASFGFTQLHHRRVEPLGRDILLEGYVHRID